MIADNSFDVANKVDRQEMNNVLSQAAEEVSQRFGFRNTDPSIHWSGSIIEIGPNGGERAKAVLGVFQSKLIRRGASLRTLDTDEPHISGKKWKITCTTGQGIKQEGTKKISKLVRDEGPRGVRVQVQDDELRVSPESRSHLQEAQHLIKKVGYDPAVQFVSYRWTSGVTSDDTKPRC